MQERKMNLIPKEFSSYRMKIVLYLTITLLLLLLKKILNEICSGE